MYAIKFYPIDKDTQQDLQNSILSYTIYPQKVNTIAQKERWKTKYNGGIKLVNIQLKSQTCKAKWLIEMAVDENGTTN